MLDMLFALARDSLLKRGYNPKDVGDVLYAMRTLNVGFLFRNRKTRDQMRKESMKVCKAQTFINGKTGKVLDVKIRHEDSEGNLK